MAFGKLDFRVDLNLSHVVEESLAKPSNPLQPKIMIPNLQEIINDQKTTAEAPLNDAHQSIFSVPESDDDAFFKSFHTMPEFDSHYEDLVKSNPDLVSSFSIGKTYEGREIRGIHIQGQKDPAKPSKEIVFHGGIHAREYIGPVSLESKNLNNRPL